MNIFTYIKAARIAYKDVATQKKYISETILPYMAALEKEYQCTFPAFQKHKILNYYCLLTPVVLSVSFRRLHNQPFTDADRKSATFAAFATPVLDDLFDEYNTNFEQIEKLTLFPDSAVAEGFFEKVAQNISSLLMDSAADKAAYIDIIKKILQIQTETLRQFDQTISSADLERITYEKASLSFIYYATHMMGEIHNPFKEVLYYVAGLLQYCNDLHDIYKDNQQKIITPAIRCRDFEVFRAQLIEKIREQNQKIMALPFPKHNKEQFCIKMATMHAVAVAITDMLIKFERKKGKGLDWNELSRKDLMFDHEKKMNTVRWFYYIAKLSKLR